MAFLSAKDARERVQKYESQRLGDIEKALLEEIDIACRNGLFSIEWCAPLPKEIRAKLLDAGYTLHDNINGDCGSVSWLER